MRKEWDVNTLENVCEMYQPKTVAKKNLIPNGKYPVFGANGIIGQYNKYNHEHPQLLVTCRGATCGTVNISEPFSWVNGNAMVIKPGEHLLKSYVAYFFRGAINVNDVITGSAQPQITRTSLNSVKIPIPSLPEQKRIVEILDEAFEAIDQAKTNIERNIENAEELFQSKLNEIFSQRGDGWEEKRLGELGRVSMCKRIYKKETSPSGEIPFFKIGTFGKEPDAFISREKYLNYKENYHYPKKGDILLSASGTIGRRVVYDGQPAYFQDSNIVWIANNEEFVTNSFLYHFYSICDWNPSKGATISRLYNDDLRKIKISFPVDKKEQEQLIEVIEDIFESIEKFKATLNSRLNCLKEFKKSVLQKAFSGELTAEEEMAA